LLISNDWQGTNEDQVHALLAAKTFFLQAIFADTNIDKSGYIFEDWLACTTPCHAM